MTTKKDQPLRMFQYWVHDKGLSVAMEVYYPNLSKTDEQIRNALQNIEIAKAQIKHRVEELLDANPETESD